MFAACQQTDLSSYEQGRGFCHLIKRADDILSIKTPKKGPEGCFQSLGVFEVVKKRGNKVLVRWGILET